MLPSSLCWIFASTFLSLILLLADQQSLVEARRLVIAAGGMYEQFDSELPSEGINPGRSEAVNSERNLLERSQSKTTSTTRPTVTTTTITPGKTAKKSQTTTKNAASKGGTKQTTRSPPPTSSTTEKPEPVASKEKRREEFYKKVQNVPIEDEHQLQLYQHWTDQALSNLFALISHHKLQQFKKPVHEEFGDCSKHAKTVPMHAKCVSDLIRGKFDGSKYEDKAAQKSARFDKYRQKKRGEFRREMKRRNSRRGGGGGDPEVDDWIGSFRMMKDAPPLPSSTEGDQTFRALPKQYSAHRRERRQTGVVKKNFYELHTPSEGRMSPLGRIAQQLMKKVLKAKGKQEQDVVPWQDTVQRIKDSALKRKEMKKRLETDDVEDMDQLTFRGLKKQGAVGEDDLHELAENPQKLRAFLAKKRAQKGAHGPMMRVVNLIRDGVKLGYAMAGKNASELDDKTMKMVSPRFLSVTPDEESEHHNGTLDFISPSLFSIHSEGKGIENLTSIPSLMRHIGGPMGFSSKDQQAWLDFIMEASGAIESAQTIEEQLNGTLSGDELLKVFRSKPVDKEKFEREIRTKDGTPLYFTKQNVSDAFADSEVDKVDLFEYLQKNISKEQVRELNKTGFVMMTKDQLELLYGPESPYADRESLERFTALDKSKVHSYIERDIHSLAELKSFKITPRQVAQPPTPPSTAVGQRRSRRQAVVLSPITFTPFIATFLNLQPIILSPIIFSPLILAPAVLGPVILSPWAFVPLVLSPRVLSPLVLSPPIFAPVILTPLVLHPIILSPGVFIPFVLSPVVLSPFILSPQVFTPLILSPLVLSPFILTPAAGSPLVLSPFVLSPIIYSPQFVSALVLSPYAFSPIIQSPLIAFSVILSPSYLS